MCRDQARAQPVGSLGANKRRLAAQGDERATCVASRAAQAEADRSGRVGARFNVGRGAYDDVEHEVADAYESWLLHEAAGNDMTAQHRGNTTGLAYVLTMN